MRKPRSALGILAALHVDALLVGILVCLIMLALGSCEAPMPTPPEGGLGSPVPHDTIQGKSLERTPTRGGG